MSVVSRSDTRIPSATFEYWRLLRPHDTGRAHGEREYGRLDNTPLSSSTFLIDHHKGMPHGFSLVREADRHNAATKHTTNRHDRIMRQWRCPLCDRDTTSSAKCCLLRLDSRRTKSRHSEKRLGYAKATREKTRNERISNSSGIPSRHLYPKQPGESW